MVKCRLGERSFYGTRVNENKNVSYFYFFFSSRISLQLSLRNLFPQRLSIVFMNDNFSRRIPWNNCAMAHHYDFRVINKIIIAYKCHNRVHLLIWNFQCRFDRIIIIMYHCRIEHRELVFYDWLNFKYHQTLTAI